MTSEPCPSCGAPEILDYCDRCGERRPSARDLSLAGFFHEAARQFTNAEAGLRRTLRTLVLQPGQLTREYMRGARRPYLSPLQLFLVCNLLFFLGESLSGAHVLSTRLQAHLSDQIYSSAVSGMVQETMREHALSQAEYIATFDATVEANSRTLVIVMVPMYALLLALFEWRRRAPFVQHVVFAFHLVAVILLIFIAFGFFLYAVGFVGGRLLGLDVSAVMRNQNAVSVIVGLVALGAYLSLALSRAYDERPPKAYLKGLAITFLTTFVLAAYRFVLFITAYWSV